MQKPSGLAHSKPRRNARDWRGPILARAAHGLVRTRDLAPDPRTRVYVRRLVDEGLLEQVSRGVYRRPESPLTELHSVAIVSRRSPRSTICLLTALQIHKLTTESPAAVWILISTKRTRPRIDDVCLEVVTATGKALTHGIERIDVESVRVRVTSPAKTVADCFRYRRHVGTEVALAALRQFVQRSRSRSKNSEDRSRYTIDALMEAARVDRVARVMQPYLEALV